MSANETEAGSRGKPRGGRHLWGAAATALALLACYGTTALLAILSLAGLTLAIDEGLWASAIAVAAVAAVAALWPNMRRHGRQLPLVLASLGAALIVYAMFVAYHPVTEALGFVLLAVAVAFDLRLLGYPGAAARR